MHAIHRLQVFMILILGTLLYSANAQTPYDRYVYGDNKGTFMNTVQTPRPMQYPIYQDTSDTSTGVANATDSSYQGPTSWVFKYNLADWDASLNGPKNFAGLGWYWLNGATVSISGATQLRFAYKMSNATHMLFVYLMCLDLNTRVCTDTTCIDSTFATRTCSYVLDGAGGTGAAGRAGWKLDSIPISAWGDSLIMTTLIGVKFGIKYLDSNITTSPKGSLKLDEICFSGVTEAAKQPLILPRAITGSFFKSNGTARVSYYSIQGREIGSAQVPVKAGKGCAEVCGCMPGKIPGAYLVKVEGAGAAFSAKLIR
jgi:hypothetical protein